MEVLANPSPKVSGFANIDHRAESIFHQIHTRLVGKLADLVTNVIVDWHEED